MSVLHSATALRQYGVWSETKYEFGTDPLNQAVARKRFTWVQKVTSKEGALEIVLSYYADAAADPRRMNELGYLAGQERKALDILEAMILKALQGVGFLGVPNPANELKKNVLQHVREWVEERAYPADWQDSLARVIDQTCMMVFQWQQRLQTVGARVEPEHQGWGLAFDILPFDPREEGT